MIFVTNAVCFLSGKADSAAADGYGLLLKGAVRRTEDCNVQAFGDCKSLCFHKQPSVFCFAKSTSLKREANSLVSKIIKTI